MNFNNFTIKSREAVQQAVNVTQARGQQAIEPVHLLAGVLKVGENVTNFIFQKLGMNAQQIALVIDKHHRDSDLEKHDLQKQTALSWSLAPEVRSYLKNSIEFSDKEIKNNLDLFISAQTLLPDLLNELAILKGKSREKKNPKGYIINAIKGKIKDRKKL